MFSTEDTIVAIATPPGRGGIGVVRISGPTATRVAAVLTDARQLEPRRATLVRVRGQGTQDEAVATWFQAPASYTGQDVVEISAHGSPVLLRSVVARAVDAGARLAEPGEFTLRAYLAGRLDLVQAEAVRDLIEAVTPLQARAAFDQLDGTLTTRIREIDAVLFDLSTRLEASLDFSEEAYHFVDPRRVAEEIDALVSTIDGLLASARAGRLVREGAAVVIAGRPNTGKSTLFNALAGASRAIVTEIAGTTRDLLTERVDINGLAVTLIDTAGIRGGTVDAIEVEGIARARQAALHADLVVLVLDRSQPLHADDGELAEGFGSIPVVVVASKADLPTPWLDPPAGEVVSVSALSGEGLDALRNAIAEALGVREVDRDPPAMTNVRHARLLELARTALVRARDAARVETPEEFIAADILEARQSIEAIVGRRTVDDTLHAIFGRFCIGK